MAHILYNVWTGRCMSWVLVFEIPGTLKVLVILTTFILHGNYLIWAACYPVGVLPSTNSSFYLVTCPILVQDNSTFPTSWFLMIKFMQVMRGTMICWNIDIHRVVDHGRGRGQVNGNNMSVVHDLDLGVEKGNEFLWAACLVPFCEQNLENKLIFLLVTLCLGKFKRGQPFSKLAKYVKK